MIFCIFRNGITFYGTRKMLYFSTIKSSTISEYEKIFYSSYGDLNNSITIDFTVFDFSIWFSFVGGMHIFLYALLCVECRPFFLPCIKICTIILTPDHLVDPFPEVISRACSTRKKH